MGRVKLDHAGIAEILKSSEVAAEMSTLAEAVASNVREDASIQRHGLEATVKVDLYTTDRAASSVTIAHPAGLGIQAKHGSLSRAAGAEGLDVRSRE